ncbi:quorum-sensing autoinducer CAI-1 synthase [Vibrio europaeus]|uniref:alpha-hydroxyketone-type quorum-sensing autoinducer synthase n=1 Tax=Vibrio europaeus TaxID=300876 RepID=UPI00233EDA90|nr:alpha-hydroxyketone-type quorum-sensing autoinducer synthase [Vibrio europaeus]MDC5806159.1 quorum-sensing autoinducer CAI-1 synthase [Vibrio europaeus]MDC5825588.1 quorum-sensing autoinducer CAI-1 synthase [Vibrio europaeus]MDC5831132.1 quorum-sensing autoinducer CAI-1 synthase [Vibrio europaeus]MDC5834088.1 quorum-sensing autoinducer CAI-1 synthase [Vibrio europaeus]MDC5850345.1 quorum-sensing autoinducer CAI-1 synthase [Vibrio europaeus]
MNMLTTRSRLPEFIDRRINYYVSDLINKKDNGRNLVLGKKPHPGDIILQSNDYLALTHHPKIIDAQVNSLLSKKDTAFMSNVFLHSDGLDKSVEHHLSDYTGFQTCTIAPSGWIANIGLLQTICDSETNVYIDFFAHMSLWEGARIAGANIHPFMHNNAKHLRRLIKRNGPGVVLIDSIYSTIGTIAPLQEMVSLAKELDCAIVVDESHSVGVYGPKGAGLLQELGLTDQVDFMTASLAKTFAYRAGAVWCNNLTGQVVPYVSFPSIFSSAMMSFELDRIDATLSVIKESDQSRKRLMECSEQVREGLANIGYNIRSESQIISLETAEKTNTRKVRDFFEDHGVFGSVFCTPATPDNKNILRLSLNSALTSTDIDKILSVAKKAHKNKELYFV